MKRKNHRNKLRDTMLYLSHFHFKRKMCPSRMFLIVSKLKDGNFLIIDFFYCYHMRYTFSVYPWFSYLNFCGGDFRFGVFGFGSLTKKKYLNIN